jgi:hypothetical protein
MVVTQGEVFMRSIVYNSARIYPHRGPTFHEYFRHKLYVVMESTDLYLPVLGYSPTNNLRGVKWRRVRWAGYVGHRGKFRNT